MTDISIFLHWELRNRRGETVAIPGETFGAATEHAADLVQRGYATCGLLKRIRFEAEATIAPPSPYAGTYEPSDALYTIDAAAAASLIASGEAVEVLPTAQPAPIP